MLEKSLYIIGAILIFVVIPVLGMSTTEKVYIITVHPLLVVNTYLHFPMCYTDMECVEITEGCSSLTPEEYCMEES